MKANRIVLILLLFAAASTAYMWMRSDPEPAGATTVRPDGRQEDIMTAVSATNEVSADTQAPVQPLEERGDAMLFEAEALGNMPFDEAIVKPFD